MSMASPQGSRGSSVQPVGQNPVAYVPVYDSWESPSFIIGFIDVLRCEYLRAADLPGFVGDAALCRTPRGVYFELVTWLATLTYTDDKLKRQAECAFFVSARRAAAWFMPAPEAAPEDLRAYCRNPSGRNPGILLFTFRARIATSWVMRIYQGSSARQSQWHARLRRESALHHHGFPDSRPPSASRRHNEGTYEVPQDGNSQSLETAARGGPIRFSSEQFPAHVAISHAPWPLFRVPRGRQRYYR